MKTIILFSYLIVSYLIIPYLFSFLGAIRKVSLSNLQELNEDEKDSEKLNESDAAQIKKVSIVFFVIFASYLYAILGVTFGFATKELVGSSFLKWILYPLLYIVMVSSFRMGRKAVEKTYEIKISTTEQIIFYLTMFVSYMSAIWAAEIIPLLFIGLSYKNEMVLSQLKHALKSSEK